MFPSLSNASAARFRPCRRRAGRRDLPCEQERHRRRDYEREDKHAAVEADTFFPALDAAEWKEIAREDHPADERHAYGYSFVTLRRVRSAGRAPVVQRSDV